MTSRLCGKFILVAISLAVSSAFASGICPGTETHVFSCSFQNKKQVSLCASTATDGTKLTYRYGKPGVTEFEFRDGANKSSSFSYAQLMQPRSNYFQLEFINRGYSYRLIRIYDDGDIAPDYQLSVGAVEVGGKHLKLHCKNDIVDDGLMNQTDVACDPSELVGCSYKDKKAAGWAM